jgi:hypothetical protein
MSGLDRFPVGAGYVDSLARPGGNATGFTSFEYGVGGSFHAPSCMYAQIIRSSGALRTHNEKPNGGAMPPGYSSRDDRCGIVRVAA